MMALSFSQTDLLLYLLKVHQLSLPFFYRKDLPSSLPRKFVFFISLFLLSGVRRYELVNKNETELGLKMRQLYCRTYFPLQAILRCDPR